MVATVSAIDLNDVERALTNTALTDKEQFEIVKAMAVPVVQGLQQNAPVNTGKVQRSIRVFRSAKNPYGNVQVGPMYIKGGGPDAGNAAHLTEFGTDDRTMKTGLKYGKLVAKTLEPFKGPPEFAPYAGKKLGRVQSREWIMRTYTQVKDVSLGIADKLITDKVTEKAKNNGVG